MKKALSTQKLKDFYYYSTHGSSVAESARQAGISYSNAVNAKKYIREYVALITDGKDKGKFLRKNYLEVARWAIEQDKITKSKPAPEPAPEKPPIEEPKVEMGFGKVDRYTKLQVAYAQFSDAVSTYIQEEVEAQVGDVIEKNKILREALERGLVSNWTNGLKKHFEGKSNG